MRQHLPWLMWRYLLAEQLRAIVLTSLGLMVAMGVGAAAVPMAGGFLGLGEVIRLIGVLCVVTLPFSLPASACFGVTVATARAMRDNEFTACAAGGMSWLVLLTPSLVSGLLVAGMALACSSEISPRFAARAATFVAPNVTRLIVNSVRQGDALRLGDQVLAATSVEDHSDVPTAIPDGAAFIASVTLKGVTVLRFDGNGRLKTDCTGDEAVATVYALAGRQYMAMSITNAQLHDADTNFATSLLELPPQELPNIELRPTHMTAEQLAMFTDSPELHPSVIRARTTLVEVLSGAAMNRAIGRVNPADGITLESLPGMPAAHVRIRGAVAKYHDYATYLSPAAETFVVEWRAADGLPRRAEARKGVMRLHSRPGDVTAIITVDLHDCRVVVGQNPPIISEIPALSFHDLTLPNAHADAFADLGVPALLATVKADFNEADYFADLLVATIRDLRAQIWAEQMFRATLSLNALVCTLLSAMLALLMRRAMLLVICVTSFVPFIGAMVWIGAARSLGGGTTPHESMALMAGAAPAVMTLLASVAYLRLRRH